MNFFKDLNERFNYFSDYPLLMFRPHQMIIHHDMFWVVTSSSGWEGRGGLFFTARMVGRFITIPPPCAHPCPGHCTISVGWHRRPHATLLILVNRHNTHSRAFRSDATRGNYRLIKWFRYVNFHDQFLRYHSVRWERRSWYVCSPSLPAQPHGKRRDTPLWTNKIH